jgi:hypothetical protein
VRVSQVQTMAAMADNGIEAPQLSKTLLSRQRKQPRVAMAGQTCRVAKGSDEVLACMGVRQLEAAGASKRK